jgi:hypothetical protein
LDRQRWQLWLSIVEGGRGDEVVLVRMGKNARRLKKSVLWSEMRVYLYDYDALSVVFGSSDCHRESGGVGG